LSKRVLSVVVLGALFVMAGPAGATTYTVDAGGGGDYTTIAAAVAAASSGDTISIVSAGAHTENSITISNKDLTIAGLGANQTIVQAAATRDTAGAGIFTLKNSATVTFQDMTLRHGDAVSGSAIYIPKWNDVHLTVERCAFVDNDASAGGYLGGGAIYHGDANAGKGDLTISDCTFSGNNVADGGGAAVLAGSLATTIIRNSTFSDNAALHDQSWLYGGVVSMGPDITGLVQNCTFVGNEFTGFGGVTNQQGGVAIAGNNITTVESCVFADNVGLGRGIVNLDGPGTDPFGTIKNSLSEGDILTWTTDGGGNTQNAADAGVDPNLAYNGGPTMTHMLLDGSPAIDTGSNPAGLSFDQRGDGFLRTYGLGTDMGAVEVQPSGAPIPEPAGLALLGLAALLKRRRR